MCLQRRHQIANKHMKRCSTSVIKSKPHWDTTSHSWEWTNKKKSQKITTVGGDVEKLFRLRTDGEPVKRNSHCEKLDGGFSEMIHRITGRSGNSTSTILNFDSFKERKAGSLRDTCTPAFMAVLVTLAKKKKKDAVENLHPRLGR